MKITKKELHIYTMPTKWGLALKLLRHINQLEKINGNIEYMKDDIENSININLNHDSFVTLKQLTKLKIVTAKSDPTASKSRKVHRL